MVIGTVTATITLKGYEFEGPYRSTPSLLNRPGVYVITGRNSSEEDHKVLDVGVSEDVRSRVENHDRKACWMDQRFRYLGCAVLYTDKEESEKIEKELRSYFNPPCGRR